LLRINYQIIDSEPSELHDVYLSVADDNNTQFDSQAVTGDIGKNISGGRSNYTITWDIYEDMDELHNPNFFMRANLVGYRIVTQ